MTGLSHTSYPIVLAAVVPVFGVIAVGFLSRKAGWLTGEADRSLLRVVVNVLYPCLIFDSILGNPALDRVENVFIPPVVGFLTILLGILVAWGVGASLPASSPTQARTFAFATGLYNYSYIPVPIVASIFDRSTMGVLFVHNLGVEIAFWTVGIVILSGARASTAWTGMLNAPVAAIIASVILNACAAKVWLPGVVLGATHMIGQSAVPVGLLLTGATLADVMVPGILRRGLPAAAASCGVRLALLPILFLLLARYLPCSQELKRVIVIQAAMPAAMLPIVIAKHYGGDADTAVQIVFCTTLVGLVTIPWWIQAGLPFAGLN